MSLLDLVSVVLAPIGLAVTASPVLAAGLHRMLYGGNVQ